MHLLANFFIKPGRAWPLLLILLVGVVAWILASLPAPVTAQSSVSWTFPQRIPEYNDIARAPFLVADRDNTIHAFNYEVFGEGDNAIFYRTWSLEDGWSQPVDIAIPGTGGQLQGAAIDGGGNLHVVYFTGDEFNGQINHIRSPAVTAGQVRSWSKPDVAGPGAGPLPFHALISDGGARLVIVYGGQENGIGLYEVHSLDYGMSWSDPRMVSPSPSDDEGPAGIRMLFDSAGRLHVVWGMVSDAGVGERVMYARMEADFDTWSPAAVLARREEGEYSTTWPSIIDDGERLILIYQDSFPATRFMRISPDGGDTWQPAVRPFSHIGEYEHAVLFKDTLGRIYMVLGNRTTLPEIHGMWFSQWLNDRWTPLEPLISGPRTDNFDPSAPQGIVAQGNILMAVWWHNVPREGLTGAWYSYAVVDAPALDITPLPTLTPTSTIQAANSSNLLNPTITPTPVDPSILAGDPLPSANDTIALGLTIGILPALLLVVFAVWRNRKR